ncbi:hypothetical protein KSF_099020 [Reticulibacter mediterranei]|uniref:Uncharacterized protein n=1 Tax=Reticulibacter mediterranei TaxID=2778369 RepID=A0A8J3IQ21_9CHLR|nr:hypothetical protein KSF_099020 [Reticulibacter mediterranei]
MSAKTAKKAGPTPRQQLHDEISRLLSGVKVHGFSEQLVNDTEKLYTQAATWLRGKPGQQPSAIAAQGIRQRLNSLIEQVRGCEFAVLSSEISFFRQYRDGFPCGARANDIAEAERFSAWVNAWKQGRFGQRPSDDEAQEIEQELTLLISDMGEGLAGRVDREISCIKKILGPNWISDKVLSKTRQLLHDTQSWLSSQPGQQHSSASLAGIMEALSSLMAHLSAIEERRQEKPVTWQHHPINRAKDLQQVFDKLRKISESLITGQTAAA